MPNKPCGYSLNTKPNNLAFLNTYNTEFDDITILFSDQKMEDRVNLLLLINK